MKLWYRIAAGVIALLAGMGVGSGGLLVVLLTRLGAVDQISAQGINLLFFTVSSGTALLFHLFRHKIRWGIVLCLILTGVAGTLAGTALAETFSPALLRKLFGGVLLLLGTVSLLRGLKSKKSKYPEEKSVKPLYK